MTADTTSQLNAGSGGDVMDESLITRSDGVTTVKRPRIVIGDDDGTLADIASTVRGINGLVTKNDPEIISLLEQIEEQSRIQSEILEAGLPELLSRATIRRWAPAQSGKRRFRLSNLESLAVTQVEAPGVEATRANVRFLMGFSAATTGIAPVQALPTTTPQWGLFNGEPRNGKTYYLEEIGMFLTSGTSGVGGTLMACLYQTPIPTGASTAGLSICPAGRPAGKASTQFYSRAIIKSSPGGITTPAAPNWFPIAVNPTGVAVTIGGFLLENRNVQGAIAIPPGFSLGLVVISPTGTTPLFAPYARWLELASDVE